MKLEQGNREKRDFKRKNIYASVRYQLKSSQEFGSVLTQDISEGGMRLNFDKFMPYNTDFILQMNLPTIPKVISAVGRVVWAHRLPHSDRYQLGLKFQEIEDKQRLEISDYLKRFSLNKTRLI